MKKHKQEKDILNYLDNQLEIFYQDHGDYPTKILLKKETQDKLFQKLDNHSPTLEGCWKESRDNYRGILLVIDESVEFFRLEE